MVFFVDYTTGVAKSDQAVQTTAVTALLAAAAGWLYRPRAVSATAA